nr:antibiotic biosynthesis monooxygenase [uncultured Desulfobulbus sp.]
MILSFITIYPQPDEEAKVIDLLDSMHGLIATNPGCADCHVLIEKGEQQAIHYQERWYSRESFEAHLRSPGYCRILEAMELSRISPKIEFFQGDIFGGFEVIGRVRLSGRKVGDSD